MGAVQAMPRHGVRQSIVSNYHKEDFMFHVRGFRRNRRHRFGHHQTVFPRRLSWIAMMTVLCGTAVAADRPNVLLICVDDLRPELNCCGVDYIQSPHIDQLARDGTLFTRHYVQAPTCGASRCVMLTGRLGGTNNAAIFQRAKQLAGGAKVWPSMPAYFAQHGYTTVSVGKVSHHPGGLGGADWNDPLQPEMPQSWDRNLLPAGQWQHPRGWMHGLAHGQIRSPGETMDVFQATPGDDSIYPDGPSIDESLRQLDQLERDNAKPFFLAVGILRPHLPLGAPAKYFQLYQDLKLPPIPHPEKPAGKTTWHRSGEFHNYNTWKKDPNIDAEFADQVRRHYGACVSYADAQVGKLVDRLKRRGLWDNTIVVLWGDHGWHLGEHAVWGKHTLFEESLRSPLIIRLPNHPGTTPCDQIVESMDLFPTLCVAAGLPEPDFATGIAMNDLLDPDKASDQTVPSTRSPFDQKGAIAHFKNARTIRTADHRLILHQSGHVELYDHRTPLAETKNVASQYPEQVDKLRQALNQRFLNPFPSDIP